MLMTNTVYLLIWLDNVMTNGFSGDAFSHNEPSSILVD